MELRSLLAAVAACLFILPLAALGQQPVDIYLRITDDGRAVRGEARDRGYENLVEVTTFSFNSRTLPHTFTVTKVPDISSPVLMTKLHRNDRLERMVVLVVRAGPTPRPVQEYEIVEPRVLSYSISTNAGQGTVETWTFGEARSLEFRYFRMTPSGPSTTPVVGGYYPPLS